MPLPKWSELSPLTRRSKRKRYELIREELNALADEIQETPESPEPQEEPEDDDDEDGEEGDNEEE